MKVCVVQKAYGTIDNIDSVYVFKTKKIFHSWAKHNGYKKINGVFTIENNYIYKHPKMQPYLYDEMVDIIINNNR
jgi:hypothetical protein